MTFLFLHAGVAGIAYAADGLAVVYECDGGAREDGTCPSSKTSVEVLRRGVPTPLTKDEIQRLTPVARRLCQSDEDFRKVDHDGKDSTTKYQVSQ